MKEAASLEVRLMDLLDGRFGAHAEQLVVREPVDPAVGVAHELRVARRALAGLRGDLDVQGLEPRRRLRRRALLAPLDDAAGEQARRGSLPVAVREVPPILSSESRSRRPSMRERM